MKGIFIILPILFLLASCSSNNNTWTSKSCHEPENPYSAWGHYEGFEWSESHWWV